MPAGYNFRVMITQYIHLNISNARRELQGTCLARSDMLAE